MAKQGSDDEGLEDLAVLAARPRRVEVYTWNKETDEQVRKTIRVAPMTLDVCSECAGIVKPMIEKLGPVITLEMLPDLIVDHKPAVCKLVAVATEEDAAYIGSLPLDQFGLLTTTVFEVNRDFFVHLVGPTYKALADKMFGGAGPTLSTVSQNTGT